MKKYLLSLLVVSFFGFLGLCTLPEKVSAASLCTQFSSASDQQRCAENYAISCGQTSGNVDCEKAAASTVISLLIREGCISGGAPASECDVQFNAAQESLGTCFTQATDTVTSCQTRAQAVTAQIANTQLQARISSQVGAPTNPPAVTNTDFQTTAPASNGNLGYTLLEPLPGLNKVQDLKLGELLSYLFRILISFGAFIAVAALVLGGITYMVSDVINKKSEALKRIQAALWGLLLLIASYLILYTINPQLLVFSLFTNPTAGLSPTNSSATTLPAGTSATPFTDTQRSTCTSNGGSVVVGSSNGNSTYTCTFN